MGASPHQTNPSHPVSKSSEFSRDSVVILGSSSPEEGL